MNLRLQVLVRPDQPEPLWRRWHRTRVEVVLRPDVDPALLGALVAELVAIHVEPVDATAHLTTRGDGARELVVSSGDHAFLRTLLDTADDPADQLDRRWGYDLTSGWRETGRPGYTLASVRHVRGGE